MTLLIKNELIKVCKQTSFKVIAIILAVCIVGAPIVNFLITKIDDLISFDISDIEYYESMAEAATSSVEKAYYEAELKHEKFWKENGIEKDDWRYRMYGGQYEDFSLMVATLNLICVEKVMPVEVFDNEFGFWELSRYDPSYWRIEDEMFIYEYGWDGPIIYESYKDIEEDDWQQLYADYCAAFDKLENYILNNPSFSFVIEQDIADTNDAVEGMKEIYEEAENTYKTAGTDANKYYLNTAKYEYNKLCAKVNYLKKYKNDISSDKDWKYIAINKLLTSAYNYCSSTLVIPYEEYAQFLGRTVSEVEYQDYVKAQEKLHASYENQLNYVIYSLDNNVPIPEIYENSTKTLWTSSFSSLSSIMIIMSVILAGTIVSREYSTGTIRLLLIRPKKRWKILLSKILALLILVLIFTFSALIISFVECLILNGVRDLFTPSLAMIGAKTISMPFFIGAFKSLGLMLLTALFMASISLLLSVLTKRSVLAIALPLILLAISDAFVLGIRLIGEYLDPNILAYTILPFFNMTIFDVSPIAELVMDVTGDSFLFLTNIISYYTTQGLSVLVGVILNVVHITLFVFLSFLTFIKSQIKS